MESYYPYMFVFGLALAGLGFLALVILAFRQRFWWGLSVVVFPPLGLVFAARHARRSVVPLLIILFGGLTAAFPALVTHFTPVDLGPLDRVVEQERHVTLTGWDQNDYSVLRTMPDAVVLQMANPDVNDATLEFLRGMSRLRELDLNDSQVSDKGLEELKGLTNLETLRLRNTKVTDKGFRDAIDPMPALKQLDLRGTSVDPDLVKNWRAAKEGRRAMR
jgi:Leucine-rich repeat (LRR) protein